MSLRRRHGNATLVSFSLPYMVSPAFARCCPPSRVKAESNSWCILFSGQSVEEMQDRHKWQLEAVHQFIQRTTAPIITEELELVRQK